MNAAMCAMFEPIRYLAAGAIGAGYTAVGTPLLYPARIINIDNLTDADLMFSFNPNYDYIVVPSQSGKVFDISSNNYVTNVAGILAFKKGVQWYVKQLEVPGPTKGVYISVMYGSDL